jgi:hypothetical protein
VWVTDRQGWRAIATKLKWNVKMGLGRETGKKMDLEEKIYTTKKKATSKTLELQ